MREGVKIERREKRLHKNTAFGWRKLSLSRWKMREFRYPVMNSKEVLFRRWGSAADIPVICGSFPQIKWKHCWMLEGWYKRHPPVERPEVRLKTKGRRRKWKNSPTPLPESSGPGCPTLEQGFWFRQRQRDSLVNKSSRLCRSAG